MYDTVASPQKEPEKMDGWVPFIFASIAVIILWGGSWIALTLWSQSWQNRGTFGDMFGAINALFSGLAFAGVITAIHLQRKELHYTREELEHTREEIAGQRAEMKLQNATLIKQNFENTFFSLLKLQQEIVQAIDIKVTRSSPPVIGRDCFKWFFKDALKDRWNILPQTITYSSPEEKISEIYKDFYQRYQSDLGHYFRTLYNIIKFIDGSELNNKKLYTNVIRAQLSSYELMLLFYNCLSPLGNEKFKPLVEKYALLKNIDKSLLLDPSHELMYDPSTYR